MGDAAQLLATQVLAALLRGLGLHILLVCLALALVLLLRPLLRRSLGAQASCLVWSAVPAAALGAVLPLPARWPELAPAAVVWVGNALSLPASGGASRAVSLALAPSTTLAALLVLTWLTGVMCVAFVLWARQRTAAAGVKHDAQGGWRTPAGSSPALLGAWRPRLVLPLDFEARFDASEQAAILAHEAAHLRRRDNLWALVATTLATLQWFNPLAWPALRRFRADQELACDAAVLSATPGVDSATYLRALLKSDELAAPLAAATTSWRGTHPLVERITMLKHHRFSPTRRRVGRACAAVLALSALAAGHATQGTPGKHAPAAPLPDTVMLHMTVDVDGTRVATPRMWGKLGQSMSIRWQPDAGATSASALEVRIITTVTESGQLRYQARLSAGEPLRTVASPTLVSAEGETARFEVRAGDGGRAINVTISGRRAISSGA